MLPYEEPDRCSLRFSSPGHRCGNHYRKRRSSSGKNAGTRPPPLPTKSSTSRPTAFSMTTARSWTWTARSTTRSPSRSTEPRTSCLRECRATSYRGRRSSWAQTHRAPPTRQSTRRVQARTWRDSRRGWAKMPFATRSSRNVPGSPLAEANA